MKKKLLFVIPSLEIGGAEKSLINLLSEFSYTEYDVDLLLLKRENSLIKYLPREVNIINPGNEFAFFSLPILQSIIYFFRQKKWDLAVSRISFAIINKLHATNKAEQYGWKYLKKSLGPFTTKYDVAVGYLEKTSIYLAVDCIAAKKKVGFIRVNYDFLKLDKKFDRKYFKKLDNICANGERSESILKRNFPEYSPKIITVLNITPTGTIKKLAEEFNPFQEDHINIVSVGRLHIQKGYDLALKVCKLLFKKGHRIKWHIIGEGPERKNIEALIREHNLDNFFVLHGQKVNPYPYIKHCDFYVQTSLYEGRSNTIIEAKILNKPIVVTNFNSVTELIEDMHNGVIVDFDPEKITDAIERLISDKSLTDIFEKNLQNEQLIGSPEIGEFYKLIDA